MDGVAYGGREYVEHPEAFGVPERNVAYVQSTRKPVDDIIAFLSEHEEELDSLDIVAADTALYRKIEEQIAELEKKNAETDTSETKTASDDSSIVWRSHIKIPEKQLV